MLLDKSRSASLIALWKQFLPLSLSDVTMAFGDPAISATMANLPNARLNLAAVGIAKSIAVFFESPVIMLLHASNALAESLKARRALWRFTRLLMVLLTGGLLTLALPGVFEWAGLHVLGVSSELIPPARTVLLFLLLWPATIAWRRIHQGLLINSGHGSTVARAGVGRLAFVLVILSLGYLLQVPGVVLAGAALIGGVLAEALLVTASSRRYPVSTLSGGENNKKLPSNLPEIWRFYWPLANSMVVIWGGRALLIAVIARAADAPLALAVWPAAWGLVVLIANSTRMVQQVIIRNRHKVSDGLLIQFALTVGAAASTIILLLGLTPWGKSGVSAFVGFDADLFDAVLPVIILCSIVPMLVALQNAIQGFLINEGRTQRVNFATWVGSGTLLLSAAVGIRLGLPGASSASVAMVLALITETATLASSFKKTRITVGFSRNTNLTRVGAIANARRG